MAVLEREAEALSRAAGHREQVRVLGLGEVDEPAVVAEVHRLELRMAVDPEPADHQPLEVPGEEVGQPEGGGLVLGQAGEVGPAGEELVAMGAGQPLHAFLGEDRVQQAAGAAVGIGDEDPLVAVAPSLADPRPNPRRDPAGPIVELGRQAGDVDVRQRLGELDELARERPATDDQRATRRVRREPLRARRERPAFVWAIRGAGMRSLGSILRRFARWAFQVAVEWP